MRSAPKWEFVYCNEPMAGCCGIEELQGFSFCRVDPYGYEYNGIKNGGAWERQQEGLPDEVPTRRQMAVHIRRMTRSAKKSYRACVATITDQTKYDRDMLACFLSAGWKEVLKTKSNHGRYYIHLLTLKRRR